MHRRILYNAIITPDGTLLHSKHVHDYILHYDKNGKPYSVDGGSWYLRRGYLDKDYKDISIVDDALHSTRRNWLHWGQNYDKDLNLLPETRYVPIKDLDTEHIYNILKISKLDSFYRSVLEDEIIYRESLID